MTTAPTVTTAQRQPELAGQTVVVIGSSAVIGLETARRARAEGAGIILTGRNPDRLERAATELGALSSAAFDASRGRDPGGSGARLGRGGGGFGRSRLVVVFGIHGSEAW